MIPFLAPLLGSLAGSLLPASVGAGIAGAVGASGSLGTLIAAAAPKALGAGIGTLIAGGDMGDAASNAMGFGLAGAGAQQGLASLFGGSNGPAAPAIDPMAAAQAVTGAGPQQGPPAGGMPGGFAPPGQVAGGGFSPLPPPQIPQAAAAPAMGLPSVLPEMGGMDLNSMIASLGPNSQAANEYLSSRGFG